MSCVEFGVLYSVLIQVFQNLVVMIEYIGTAVIVHPLLFGYKSKESDFFLLDITRMNNYCLVIFVVVAVSVAIVLLSSKCNGMLEGYKRSCLGQTCRMARTPVDYAFKTPNGWQRNPHWQANPADKYQPLTEGPIEFYPDIKNLNANNGVLFKQYGNEWKGCGKDQVYLINDSKTRFDLENLGDHWPREIMDSLPHPRLIPGCGSTEMDHVEVDPWGDKIYGGAGYLIHEDIGQ